MKAARNRLGLCWAPRTRKIDTSRGRLGSPASQIGTRRATTPSSRESHRSPTPPERCGAVRAGRRETASLIRDCPCSGIATVAVERGSARRFCRGPVAFFPDPASKAVGARVEDGRGGPRRSVDCGQRLGLAAGVPRPSSSASRGVLAASSTAEAVDHAARDALHDDRGTQARRRP